MEKINEPLDDLGPLIQADLTQSVEDQYKKLTNIIDGARLGTWEWNVKTGEMTCNHYWRNMLGYLLTELEPISINTWERLTHPEDLLIANDLLDKHLSGETEYFECEMRMKHKDGRWIWIQGRGKVFKEDVDGSPLIMFGTHLDISRNKEAERILKESEKRFFLALDMTKAGLWDMDLINPSFYHPCGSKS